MRNDPIHKWLGFGFLSLFCSLSSIHCNCRIFILFLFVPVLIKSFWHSCCSWNDIFVLIFCFFAQFSFLFMSFSGALQLVKLHSAHKMKQRMLEHWQDWLMTKKDGRGGGRCEQFRRKHIQEEIQWEAIIDQFDWEWKIYFARVINCLKMVNFALILFNNEICKRLNLDWWLKCMDFMVLFTINELLKEN